MNMIKKSLAVAVILLFIGVALAPSINVVVAKEALRKTLIDSSTLSKKNLGTLPQQKIRELRGSFDSIKEKVVNVEKKDGPGLWLLFLILQVLSIIINTINYVVNLINEGKVASEVFRGICVLVFIIYLRFVVWIEAFFLLLDLAIPWDLHFENSLFFRLMNWILVWLENIVFPDNQLILNNANRLIKNKISTEIEEG